MSAKRKDQRRYGQDEIKEIVEELQELHAEIDKVVKENGQLKTLVNEAKIHEAERKNFPKLDNATATVYSWLDTPEVCGVCRKPKSEWKEIKETNPWFSRGEYSDGVYSTWNPYFNDRRVYRSFCYECWCRHRDVIMCCGAWIDSSRVTYVVSNWPKNQTFKVWRETSQKWDETATFWNRQWNQKEAPDKSLKDLEKEQEHAQFVQLHRTLGELCMFVKIDTFGYKLVTIKDLEKWNPDLPQLKFRFPNQISFESILNALPKQSYEDHMNLGYFAWLAKWYDPTVC